MACQRDEPIHSHTVESKASWIRRTLVAGSLLLLAVAGFSSVLAADYYLAVDVPNKLSGSSPIPPNWLLQKLGTYYANEGPILPNGVEASAVHREADGTWLLTPATPADLNGISAGPRDVVTTTGLGAPFTLLFDGAAAGIPDGVRIDALLLDESGMMVFSFDVPVKLNGTEYSRSDLVRYEGGTSFSLFWDAEGPPQVPAYANVVGADLASDGTLVVTFDVPTRILGTEYLPGQLVAWNSAGGFFTSYSLDPAWPPDLQLRDFSLTIPAGAVPDGGSTPGVPLTVEGGGGGLLLSWGAACGTADDYEIYEGTIGNFYSHVSIQCSTGGATSATIIPAAGDTYYLVVPRNAQREGSYGLDSSGIERPIGDDNCLSQQIASCP
jgi:hypothetical protein